MKRNEIPTIAPKMIRAACHHSMPLFPHRGDVDHTGGVEVEVVGSFLGEGDVGIDHAAEVVGCPDVPEPDVVVAVDELEDLDGGVLLDLDVEELREVGAVLVLGGLIAALDLPGEVLLAGEVLVADEVVVARLTLNGVGGGFVLLEPTADVVHRGTRCKPQNGESKKSDEK